MALRACAGPRAPCTLNAAALPRCTFASASSKPRSPPRHHAHSCGAPTRAGAYALLQLCTGGARQGRCGCLTGAHGETVHDGAFIRACGARSARGVCS